MSKLRTVFICQECGHECLKWCGQCPECGAWNSMVEDVVSDELPSKQKTAILDVDIQEDEISKITDVNVGDEYRYVTEIKELDRVVGGGIVKGSVTLLGGDPGIGKSTMLLQICGKLAGKLKILYVSGEESKSQLKLRAQRLGVSSDSLLIAPYTDITKVVNAITSEKPDMVMVDSIQTMVFSAIASSAGSVTQVKECTSILTKVAKSADVPIIIVGHVNKDGAIAGPKVMEHIVDTVLYFEGERTMSYRILRSIKNRFGSTNEIGIFEMDSDGLHEVENPSVALLSERPINVSGTCVSCVIEGTRPIFAEVQALVSKTGFGTPRRTSTGFDFNRTALLIAVLEKRAGYFFGSCDTYINVIGGLKLDEPAADLPVAISLVSSLTDTVVDPGIVAFGEIGLGGELRSVSHAEDRIKEAEKLGFKEVILPKQCIAKLKKSDYRIKLIGVASVNDAFKAIKGDIE